MQTTFDFPTPLAEKYQPKRVAEFLCEKPRRILSNFVRKPYPSAWYFLGESGTGKTTMALRMADEIPAELHHMASRECDLAAVQAIAKQCHYMPRMQDDWQPCKLHLVLVDEAHTMSPAARDAWLSKLDDTERPPNTVFVFTGNDKPNDPNGAFMSRVRLVEFSSYGLATEMVKLLQRVWATETGGLMNPPNFARLVKDAKNNIRDAFMALELELMAAEPSTPAVGGDAACGHANQLLC